jgi:hypothetical protein
MVPPEVDFCLMNIDARSAGPHSPLSPAALNKPTATWLARWVDKRNLNSNKHTKTMKCLQRFLCVGGLRLWVTCDLHLFPTASSQSPFGLGQLLFILFWFDTPKLSPSCSCACSELEPSKSPAPVRRGCWVNPDIWPGQPRPACPVWPMVP